MSLVSHKVFIKNKKCGEVKYFFIFAPLIALRYRGRAARQSSAKACTSVRI